MPYYCAQCNKSFTFQQSYHKHMLYHSSEKPHLCSECGRAFKELSTLHNHERIHSGERPFVCETCGNIPIIIISIFLILNIFTGKSFRQRVSYLVHRRIHTGVMPYKCTACDKSFRYKISQKSHKCPANPPGSVVRAAPNLAEKLIEKTNAQIDEGNNNEVTISHVADGNQNYSINLYPRQQNCVVRLENEEISLKNSINANLLGPSNNLNLENGMKFGNHINTIIFNTEGQIIGQNFAFDGQNIITITPKVISNDCSSMKNIRINNKNNSASKIDLVNTAMDATYEHNKSSDFLPMVLSPIIPDVQSLCLSGSPISDHEDCGVKQEPLETINEESFKSLLDGLSNCI